MAQVASDITVEIDFDNDGDFSVSNVENITSQVLDLSVSTGRDYPSQLQGRSTPGQLTMRVKNTDDRWNYFNTSSPYNTAPYSTDSGRLVRVRTTESTPADPALYARDRFPTPGASLSTTENGVSWTTRTGGWEKDGKGFARGTSGTNMATVPVGSNDFHAAVRIKNLDGPMTVGDGNRGALCYRVTDSNNYGLVWWIRGAVSHAVITGGATGTITTHTVDDVDSIDLQINVVGTTVRAYANGCHLFDATARTAAQNNVGIWSQHVVQRQPVFSQFSAWSGLAEPWDGALWTGSLTSVETSVSATGEKYATIKAEGPLSALATLDVDPVNSYGYLWQVNAGGTASFGVGMALSLADKLAPVWDGFGEGDTGWTLGSTSLDRGNALDIARRFEATQGGMIRETPEGFVTFDGLDFRALFNGSSEATFSDAPGATLGYEAITPFDWRRDVINRVESTVQPRCPEFVTSWTNSWQNPPANGASPSFNLTFAIGWALPGDLALIVFQETLSPGPWTTPAGWTQLRSLQGESGRIRIYAKAVEAADIVDNELVVADNSTTNLGGTWALAGFIIRNWYGSVQGGVTLSEVIGPPYDSTPAHDGTINQPVVLNGWGIGPTFYLTIRAGAGHAGGGNPSVSGADDALAPDGYGGMGSYYVDASGTFGDQSQDVALQWAHRVESTSIGYPGPFGGTFTGFASLEAVTIAVRAFNGNPPPASGNVTVTSDDMTSQFKHRAIKTHATAGELFGFDSDAANYNANILSRYADDAPVFGIGFSANKSSSHRDQARLRRVGDRVTIVATNRSGQGVNRDFFIETIRHTITNGNTRWYTEYDLSPAQLSYDTTKDLVAAELIPRNQVIAWMPNTTSADSRRDSVNPGWEQGQYLSAETNGDTSHTYGFWYPTTAGAGPAYNNADYLFKHSTGSAFSGTGYAQAIIQNGTYAGSYQARLSRRLDQEGAALAVTARGLYFSWRMRFPAAITYDNSGGWTRQWEWYESSSPFTVASIGAGRNVAEESAMRWRVNLDDVGSMDLTQQNSPSIPINQWIHCEVFLVVSNGYDDKLGRLSFWADGVRVVEHIGPTIASGWSQFAVGWCNGGHQLGQATVQVDFDECLISTTATVPRLNLPQTGGGFG